MTTYLHTWDTAFESEPNDNTYISEIAAHIRILKEAVRETFETLRWDMDADGLTISSAVLNDFAEKVYVQTISTTYAIDFTNGNVHSLTLAGNTTLSIINPPATGLAGELLLIFKQNGTGGYSVTWPASVKFPGSATPTFTLTANKAFIVSLFTVDGGTTYYPSIVGDNY